MLQKSVEPSVFGFGCTHRCCTALSLSHPRLQEARGEDGVGGRDASNVAIAVEHWMLCAPPTRSIQMAPIPLTVSPAPPRGFWFGQCKQTWGKAKDITLLVEEANKVLL